MPVQLRRGTAVIRFEVLETCLNFQHRKFILSAVANSSTDIAPVVSENLCSVCYQFVIENNTPEIWYKDEKDDFIEVKIHLINRAGPCTIDRKVPLRVSLHYESGQLVDRQDILKLFGDLKCKLDSKGACCVRFRIEDVSKNHENQKFFVVISPDTLQFPMNCDIGPVSSGVIEVRGQRKIARDNYLQMSGRNSIYSQQSAFPTSSLPTSSFPPPPYGNEYAASFDHNYSPYAPITGPPMNGLPPISSNPSFADNIPSRSESNTSNNPDLLLSSVKLGK
jgi:hypothetical protein